MKNEKSKIIKTGLVAFLLIIGFNSVFASALNLTDSNEANFKSPPELKPPEAIKIEKPLNGAPFLEPKPFQTKYVEIRVVNQLGNPVYDAIIHVYEQGQNQYFIWGGLTDEDGAAQWPIPNVDSDTRYRIKAEKYVNGNYLVSCVYVKIRNRALEVSTSDNPVDEGANFFAIVKDQDNQPVPLAKVKFNGETRFTNDNGITSSFKAPWVDGDTVFIVKASAPLRGYDSDYSELIVRDCGSSLPHKVYGQVRDYDFNPMQNVKIKIILEDYSCITYTDEAGDYSIFVTPKEGGEWVTITASYPGYPTQSVKKWMNSADTDSTHVNFWLVKEDGNGNQNTPQGQQAQVQQLRYCSYENQELKILE